MRTLSVVGLLLPLVLLTSGERPTDRSLMVVVNGPLQASQAETLKHSIAYYGDFGTLSVGEASARALSKLRALGLDVTVLGRWPAERQLVVGTAGDMPEGSTVLFGNGRQSLATLPADAPRQASCHQLALVERRAWQPISGFRGAAAPPAGADAGPGSDPPAGTAAALAADARITPLIGQVSAANIQATVTQLSSWFTRRADSSEVLLAKDWLVAELSALPGVVVSTETFDGGFGPNVIAEIPGSVHPERLVIVGAHYDSINDAGSSQPAPGADDNASGSAGVLEIARLLSDQPLENTVRCVWFCAEEFGLVGADAHAANLVSQGAEVVAMLNMDMISHLEPGDAYDLDFATNNTDPALTQFCRDVTAAYVPGLPTVTGVLTAGSSDHAAFTSHGFSAAFLFEDLTEYSTAIHTSADTVGSSANDFGLAADITRVCLAAVATLARPVDMTMAHTPLTDTTDAGGPYALAADVASLTGADVDTVTAFYRVDGGAEQSADLIGSVTPGTWVGSLPGVQPSGDVAYWLLATDSDGHTQWLPEGLAPGDATWRFMVGDVQAVFADDFEGPTDNGWTHVLGLEQDDWQRGTPAGKAGDPSTAAVGAKVWGNDLGPEGWNGQYKANVDNWLESPSIDASGQTGLHLRFKRWLTVEDGFYDQATVAIDGNVVWQNPTTPGGGTDNTIDTEWTQQDIDVSALADNDPSVTIRFRLQTDGGVEFGGWTLDDLQLARVDAGSVDALTASALHLSATGGGVVTLDLDAGPGYAGRIYVVALSVTGTAPGTPIGSVVVPLNFDTVTQFAFGYLNTPVFTNFAGLLSPEGKASATFFSPPIAEPVLPGLPLHMAFFTLNPIDFASNPITIQYQP